MANFYYENNDKDEKLSFFSRIKKRINAFFSGIKKNWKKIAACVVLMALAITGIKHFENMHQDYHYNTGSNSRNAVRDVSDDPGGDENHLQDILSQQLTDSNYDKPDTKDISPGSDNPYEVSGHIRKLPDGYHASEQKREEAQRLGIPLAENETFVSPYTKNQKS